MGDVYRVWDPVRGRELALKLLKQTHPRALHYFKREFRAVAELAHPGLVKLFDLHAEAGQYFFTMELLEGSDLYEWVNGHDRTETRPPRLLEPARVERVRTGIVELLRALAYLHGHGRIHRDIKPSNILVDARGHVRLLDFGIVKEILPVREGSSISQVFGTATYMSPEQASAGTITASTDLYAVGIVLYELLVGVPPFDGDDDLKVMDQQRNDPPPSLVRRLPGIAPDLAVLCMALLSKDPGERPGAREALEMLRADPGDAAEQGDTLFVGRRQERKTLTMALEAVRDGEGRMVIVEGGSGLGKSSLVRAFAAEVPIFTAIPFTATCVGQDHVPTHGLDTLIERIAEAWRRRTAEIVRDLPANERGALLALFPFLKELLPASLHNEPRKGDTIVGTAGRALKTLLTELARKRLLVLALDDVHHADPVTLRLLEALQHGGTLPPVLWVLTVNPEAATANHRLRAFVDLSANHPAVRRLRLAPLTVKETERLLGEALPPGETLPDIGAVHRETGGDPLHLREVIRALRRDPDAPPPSLEAVVTARASGLPADARLALDALAIHTDPVPMNVLEQVTGLDADRLAPALDALAAEGLARVGSVGRGDLMVVPAHARLMHAARSGVEPARRTALHAGFAEAYQAGGGSPAAIFAHWRAAGAPEKAPAYALGAAAAARAEGDHEQAAALLELAIGDPTTAEQVPAARLDLVDSLERTGRYAAAAHALEPVRRERRTTGEPLAVVQAELFLMAGDLQSFDARVEALPPEVSTVRLADLLVPVDPVRASHILGEARTPAAMLVYARLLAGENSLRAVAKAGRTLRKCHPDFVDADAETAAAFDVADAVVRRAQGQPQRAMAAIERGLGRFGGRPPTSLVGLRLQLGRAWIAFDLGQVSVARERGHQLLADARRRQLPGVVARAAIFQARVLAAAGELPQAERLLDEADALWPDTVRALPQVSLALARAQLAIEDGRPADAITMLHALEADEGLAVFMERRESQRTLLLLTARAHAVEALRGWRAGRGGPRKNTLDALQGALARLRKAIPTPEAQIAVLSGVHELALGQPKRALGQFGRAIDVATTPLDRAAGLYLYGVSHAAAGLGDGVGEVERATAALRDAGAAPPAEVRAAR
jgi:tetratricopeptide (TPR) repeat protein